MFVIWEIIKVAMTNAAEAKFNQVVALKLSHLDFESAVNACGPMLPLALPG